MLGRLQENSINNLSICVDIVPKDGLVKENYILTWRLQKLLMLCYMVYRKRNSEFKLCQNDNSFFGIDIGEGSKSISSDCNILFGIYKTYTDPFSFEPYRQLLHSYQHTKDYRNCL